MPYGGTNKEQDKKIESCVNDLMNDPKFKPRKGKDKKSSAIAICKSSIMQGEKMEKETFTYTPEEKMKFAGTKITNVHIFKPGEYRGTKWTKDIVNKIVENFNTLKEKIGFQPPVRIGHRTNDPVQNAKSVIGYIENISADEEGNLFADTEIFDDKDVENFKRLKRSIEFGPYETNEGEEFDNVLWGLGLVDIPQVERLAEVNVYSKPLEEMANKQPYGEVAYADPGYQKDKVKRYPIDTEEHIRAAWSYINMPKNASKYSAEQLKSIKNRIKSAAKKFGIKIEETNMDKEGIKEETLAEETSEGKDDKVKLEKEEAKDEDEEKKGEESEEKSEDMTKESEMVSMSKEEAAELKAAKEKLEKIEVEKAKTKLALRAEKIDAFHKEAKIVPAMLDKEKEFAQSLSDEQFDKYVEIKNSMPKLVELGKESGSQTSNEPDKDTEAQKLEKVTQKAKELVVNSLIRQGYSKEEAEKLLENKK